jgi:hypothetical protein
VIIWRCDAEGGSVLTDADGAINPNRSRRGSRPAFHVQTSDRFHHAASPR